MWSLRIYLVFVGQASNTLGFSYRPQEGITNIGSPLCQTCISTIQNPMKLSTFLGLCLMDNKDPVEARASCLHFIILLRYSQLVGISSIETCQDFNMCKLPVESSKIKRKGFGGGRGGGGGRGSISSGRSSSSWSSGSGSSSRSWVTGSRYHMVGHTYGGGGGGGGGYYSSNEEDDDDEVYLEDSSDNNMIAVSVIIVACIIGGLILLWLWTRMQNELKKEDEKLKKLTR